MTCATVFAIWMRVVLLLQSKGALALPKARGIAKGEALLLQRLLIRRFGALPSALVSRIAQATSEQLERWDDRILDARSLD